MPADTARAAQSACIPGTPAWVLGHECETTLATWWSARQAGPEAGERGTFLQKTLVTLLQISERLTDREAAEAIRKRSDWKCALRISLDHPGFSARELCRFRQQLRNDNESWQSFVELLCGLASAHPLFRHLRGPAETDRALIELCALNQIVWVSESMAHALELLAALHPEWLRQIALPHWYTRYTSSGALPDLPNAADDTYARAHAIHADVAYLLRRIAEIEGTSLINEPEIRRLRFTLGTRAEVGRSQGCRCANCAACCVSEEFCAE